MLGMAGWCPWLRAEESVTDSPQAHAIERALKKSPNDAVLHYNLGVDAYRAKDYEAAAKALEQALASGGKKIQSAGAYNLGNAEYLLAQAAEKSSPEKAAPYYEKALGHFRTAIRENPADRDAQFNYELADKRLKTLKQEAQQQKQQQQEEKKEGQGQQGQQQQSQAEEKKQTQAGTAQDQSSSAAKEDQNQQADKQQAAAGNDDKDKSKDQQELSKQEALWILDTVKQHEQRIPSTQQKQRATERAVEQNW